jgi:hypothetical protein
VRSTTNDQRPTVNDQRPTTNEQRTTNNEQRPTTNDQRTSPFRGRSRRGLSLLEILISIFVLAVGLLGVISIVPLGQMTIAEGQKFDRAGACGRAVMRNIKVKRLLDFRSWVWEPGTDGNPGIWGWGWHDTVVPNGGNPYILRERLPVTDPDINVGSQLPDALSCYVIDPLGRARGLPSIFFLPRGCQVGASVSFQFPLPPNGPGAPPASSMPLPILARHGLSPTFLKMGVPAVPNFPLVRPFLNGTAFVWPDDISFETPESAVERPLINANSRLDTGRSYDYSYLFTVSQTSTDKTLPIPKRRMFDVTVVVFFQRNLNRDPNGFPEGEWIADVASVSGLTPSYGDPTISDPVSPGGGTLAIGPVGSASRLPVSPTGACRVRGNSGGQQTMNLALNMLPNVREGQWVLMWDPGNIGDPPAPTNPAVWDWHSGNGRMAWYRVVGVNYPEQPTPANLPTLTLDGPDWRVSKGGTEKLIFIDGAIGAYTSTVELDYDPLWQGMD